VGDFNYNDINWETFTVSDLSSAPQPSEEFLEILSTCTLHQHVSEPTRFKPSVLPSLLDLVITGARLVTCLIYHQAKVTNIFF